MLTESKLSLRWELKLQQYITRWLLSHVIIIGDVKILVYKYTWTCHRYVYYRKGKRTSQTPNTHILSLHRLSNWSLSGHTVHLLRYISWTYRSTLNSIFVTDISRGELRTPPAGMTLHKTSMSWEDADRKCKREGTSQCIIRITIHDINCFLLWLSWNATIWSQLTI